MIRRPSRTALHTALSALAGGFRGTAAQREQDRLEQQRKTENERYALTQALQIAGMQERGWTPRAQAAPTPALPATPTAPGAAAPTPPAPPATPRPSIRIGEQEYILSETVPEREARLARERRAEEVEDARTAQANALALVRARAAAEEAAKGRETEADLAQRRSAARGWFSRTTQTATQEERNRLGNAFAEIARSVANPDDAMVALMDAEKAREEAEAARALTRQRAIEARRAEALLAEEEAERARAEAERKRAEAEAAEAAGTTSPPARPAAPAAVTAPPAARPAAPAPTAAPAAAPAASPRPAAPATAEAPITDAEYDLALDALGADAPEADVINYILRQRASRRRR